MAAWHELTEEQLKALSTHRLREVHKRYQASLPYALWENEMHDSTVDPDLSAKADFIKKELDTREHLARKRPQKTISERLNMQWNKYWKERDALRKSEEPPKHSQRFNKIKDPESCIGKQVFKVSGKPFLSKEKYNTVEGITVNPHTHHPAFTFVEDASIVDAHICDVRK